MLESLNEKVNTATTTVSSAWSDVHKSHASRVFTNGTWCAMEWKLQSN